MTYFPSKKYLAQARDFLKNRVPIDGLGVQGHFKETISGAEIWSRLDQLAEPKIPIWVTELDYANKGQEKKAQFLQDALLAFFR